jgi:hypothetical protein
VGGGTGAVVAGLVGEGLVAGGAFVAGEEGPGGAGMMIGGCPDVLPEPDPAGDVGEMTGTSVALGGWVAAFEPGVTSLGVVPALPPVEPEPPPPPPEPEPPEPADDPLPASLTVCC